MTRRADTTGGAGEAPDLAARIQAGDPAAVESVARAYLPQILRTARGAGLDAEEAEDVTQATFATFIEAAPRFEGRSKVRTWLYGILYKKIAETRRARQRDRQMDAIDEDFERRFDPAGGWSRAPQPIDVTLHKQGVEREIFACLDAAPLRHALAFILREVEELSTEDICNVLGITVTNPNLGVMLHRVRHRVRDCLEAKGVRE